MAAAACHGRPRTARACHCAPASRVGRARLQRGGGHRRRGRRALRGRARGDGPAVGDPRGRQREHGRDAASGSRRCSATRASGCCATTPTAARATRCAAGCSRRAASCGCTATPTARPRCALAARPARGRRARRRRGRRLARSRRARASGAASRCGAGSSGAASRSSAGPMLREPTRDLFCGFKLWRAEAAEAAFSRARLDGWTFDAEALAMARALGYRLREVGIVWTDREGSRLSMPRVLVPVVRELLAARAHVRAARDAPGRACPGRRAAGGTRPAPRRRDAPRLGRPGGARAARRARRRSRWRRSPACCCASGSAAAISRAATASWSSTSCSTSTGCARRASTCSSPTSTTSRPGRARSCIPGLLLSGALHALGLGMAAAYLVWKPVAVLALWAGALAWAGRFLERARRPRLAAAVLALLFASPVAAVVGWPGLGGERTRFHFDFLGGELSAGNYLWGYLFTAIAVGLLPLGLLAYERGADRGCAAAAGLLSRGCSRGRARPSCSCCSPRRPSSGAAANAAAAPAARARGAATAAPLAYYLALSQLGRRPGSSPARANDFGAWPWWVTVLGLAPLAVPAAFASGAPRTTSAAGRCGCGRSRRSRSSPAGRDLPLPRVPGARAAARRARRARRSRARLRTGGGGRRARRCSWCPARSTASTSCARAVNAGRQPFFLDATASTTRCAGSTRAPARAACWRRSTAGCWCPPTPGARRGSAPAPGRRTSTRARRPPSGCSPGGWIARRRRRSCAARARASCSRDCHGRADIGAARGRLTEPPRRFGCATVWEVAVIAHGAPAGALPALRSTRARDRGAVVLAYHVAFHRGAEGGRAVAVRASSTSACRSSS